MQNITSEKLLEILNISGKTPAVEFNSVITDSRKSQKGALFVAIAGENLDGHNFVAQALKDGAELAIVEKLMLDAPLDRQLVVESCLDAYGKIGSYNRSLFKGVVIGLTGSAGKTTTKEEIKFALSQFGKVYATSGNFNNHIGVPYTLCEMDMEADYAVIEMGMSAKGEISTLTSFVKPDVALVTNVYPMHIEFFDNLEGIAEAKAEIFEGLKKGGIAVINQDTNFADILEKRALEHGAKVYKFGKNNHYREKLNQLQDADAQLYNAWATLTVVESLGLDTSQVATSLKNFEPLEGRGKVHQLSLKNGIKYTFIDDSYSGQPEAMKLAINNLSHIKTRGRKIAVLGKMAELGETSQAQHIAVGKCLASQKIDIVVAVCPEMKDMLAELPNSMEQYYFENKDGLYEFLTNKLLQNGDILLIKGARYSSKLYQVAEALLGK